MNDHMVRNDEGRSRYELDTDGGVAIAAYRRDGGVMVFTHTAVPEDARGKGVASRLIAGALADVRVRGLKVRPDCPFVADYIDGHAEARDLLA